MSLMMTAEAVCLMRVLFFDRLLQKLWVFPLPHSHSLLKVSAHSSRVGILIWYGKKYFAGTVEKNSKGKVFPYSLPSVGPRADPSVQAVSPQVTWSESHHIPSSSLPLLSAGPAFYLRSVHQMALPVNGSTHLIPAYYLFIDPEMMKGWVGLVGSPVVDGLPTLVVTHQLEVERRTGKVRQSETDVLPLCHATNLSVVVVQFYCTIWLD